MYASSPQPPYGKNPQNDKDSFWSKAAQILIVAGFIFFLIGLFNMSPFYNFSEGGRDWTTIGVMWGCTVISILLSMLFNWIDNKFIK